MFRTLTPRVPLHPDQAALTHGRSTAMLIRVKVEYNQMLLIKVSTPESNS